MKKVINPGYNVFGGNNHKEHLFCSIEFYKGNLSITGVRGPKSNGNCSGGCGQINPIIIKHFAKGWNQVLLDKFNAVWHEWHLNDMQAGCEHQRALGWDDYNKHPSEPCPTCGYKYGTALLHKEVPQDVIEFLELLPETKITPAWV
jgi:hypothetical protein